MKRSPHRVVYGVTAGTSAWTLLRGQLAAMRERGWEVHLAAAPDRRFRDAVIRERVTPQPIPMTRPIDLPADLGALLRWIVMLGRVRPGVLSVGTPKAALLGSIAGWVTRVPTRVYVVRGLRFEGVVGWRRSLLLAMERVTIAASTDVVVVSASMAAVMHRAGLSRRPLLLIGSGSSNGVDSPAVRDRLARTSRPDVRRALGIGPGAFVVGFVGRATDDKGVDTLLDALELLGHGPAPVELLITGDVESGELEQRLRSSPVPTHVTGWVDDVISLFPAMDVLCLPTRREGFPNVVLEANAAGVPVVTTRATGAVDSVVDGETGALVPVDDPQALADVLGLVRADRARAARWASAARCRADTEFAPARIWDGLDSIYRGRPSEDVRSAAP